MEKVNSAPSRQPKNVKEPYAYFKPSEMIFVIRHPTDAVPTEQEIDDLLERRNMGGLIGWSNQKIVERKYKISRVRNRELHFPGTNLLPTPSKLDVDMPTGVEYKSPELRPRNAFSLIPVDVRTVANDDNPDGLVDTAELATLIAELDDERLDLEKNLNYVPYDKKDDKRDDDRDREGDRDEIKNDNRDEDKKITVEIISPNWLSSPAMSEYGGGGGPGSRPVPYKGRPDAAPSKFHLPALEKDLWPKEEDKRGEGVKVAILDTAPCQHDLMEAYEFYEKVRPARRKKQETEGGFHPLIKTLLKPGGPLHLHPASAEDLDRMRAVHLRDHDYIMTDHGLFVAGIIHSIAPAAELHLYEVLNPQGAGDLETIARALWKIFDELYQAFKKTKEHQPWVINCSLMLYIPLDGDPDKLNVARVISSDSPLPVVGHRLTDMEPALVEKIRNGSDKLFERSGSVLLWICDLLYLLGARVIAAAGNDWDPSDAGRPQARYPAAFPSVQGVGALKKEQSQAALMRNANFDVASYSDLSDQPGKVGIATLGGEPGEGRGVLGVYLGEFPEPPPDELPILHRILKWLAGLFGGKYVYPKNDSHWAWWAGTSFATPILSGVIAAVLSSSAPPPTIEGAIVELYKARAIQEARTGYEEDLLKVTQS
jgi:hypothetical protein